MSQPDQSDDSSPTLDALDLDGVERILCVAAHPDDTEYGISTAAASWIDRGITVDYLLLTAGEAGIATMAPEEVGPLRRKEQRAACDAVGVNDLVFLDFPDGCVEYNLELRKAIAGGIRRLRPNLVVVGTWELESPWGLNHVDHRAVGLATVDAIRDADNPWMFRDVEGGQRWKADRLLVNGHPNPTSFVRVSDSDLERGIASLEAHAVYLEALDDHMAPSDLITGLTTGGGEAARAAGAADVEKAVLFTEFGM